MRSLEEVLKELNEAEKEFKKKCEKYGIEETKKRKPKENENEASNDVKTDEISQNNG